MKKIAAALIGVLCILGIGVGQSSSAMVIDVAVDSHTMPWLSNTTLNPTFHFGVQDGAGPVVVSPASGFSFAAGGTFTTLYLSGLTNAFGATPNEDANGQASFPFNNQPGSTGKFAPSLYMDPATYPINLMELVGTFADASGTIVGAPFELGNGPTSVIVPVGAMRLQLGLNDDRFSDNTGALMVRVSGPSLPSTVPVPATMLLLGSGLIGLIGYGRKKFLKR